MNRANMGCMLRMLLVVAPTPLIAQGACLPPLGVAETSQPAHSVQLMVAVFRRGDLAHDSLTSLQASTNPLLTMRRAAAEARCAGDLTELVAGSADSLTHSLFEVAALSFRSITAGINTLRELVILQADRPGGQSTAREDDLSASSVEMIDHSWRGLMPVGLGMVSMLNGFGDSTKTLTVTEKERLAILAEIRSQFGRALTEQDSRKNYPRLLAYSIQSVLQRADWKARR